MNSNGFSGKKFFMVIIFAAFVACTLLLAGCKPAAEQVTPPAQNVADNAVKENAPPEPVPPEPVAPVPPPKQVDIVTNNTKPAEQQTQETIATLIADGTYTDKVSYNYHSGTEQVEIIVSVKDDIITAATLTGINPTSPISDKYQKGVNAALPGLVVGKRIDQLNLPKQISGSSLTTAAFKKYVEDITAKY